MDLSTKEIADVRHAFIATTSRESVRQKLAITGRNINLLTFLQAFNVQAVLVGSVVDGKPNFMTAAWCGIACMKPPALSLAINHTRHTLKGIEEEKAFCINVPLTELVKEVDFCGIYSGKNKDKSGMYDLNFA